MALARTIELLKRGERAIDELQAATIRSDRRDAHPKPPMERALDPWTRFRLASLVVDRSPST
jgi:hypothetical protein